MKHELIELWMAAEELGITEGTLSSMIRRGKIEVIRLGPRSVRVSRAELNRLVDTCRVPARPEPVARSKSLNDSL